METTPRLLTAIDNELNFTLLNKVPKELKELFTNAFWGKWRYNYLFVNDYDAWEQQFIDTMLKIKWEFDLRLSGYIEINSKWIDIDVDITTDSESQNDINVSRETSQNATSITINTSIVETSQNGNNTVSTEMTESNNLTRNSTDTKTGKDTTTNDLSDKTTYNVTDAKTGTDITDKTGHDTETINITLSKTGKDTRNEAGNSTTQTVDDTVTTKTVDLTDGQIGVKTTSSVPSADTVIKEITTALNPPMNAVDGVMSQGDDKKINSDNLSANDPFTVNSQGYTSAATETIRYTNLQRESNGNYKQNITTDTYGEINTNTGLYEPLKNTHTGTETTTTGRPDGADYNTVVTGANNIDTTTTYDTKDVTSGTNNTDSTAKDTVTYDSATKRTGDETTTKSGTVAVNYDTTDTITGTETAEKTNNVTESGESSQTSRVEGMDDDSHNVKNTVENTTNGTDTTTNTGSTSGSTKGHNRTKALLYQDFIDAINKSDFIGWFVNSFSPIFSVYLALDDRCIYQFNAIEEG